jgi:hypothetical protein
LTSTNVTASPILALDLGKDKSVACAYVSSSAVQVGIESKAAWAVQRS